MTCHRARVIDVDDFLLNAETPDVEDFRSHYPTCPDCSERVAEWMLIREALTEELGSRGGTTRAHPEPEMLEAWVSRHPSSESRAEEISMHVSGCSTCQAEVALLERFDPGSAFADVAARSVEAGWAARVSALLASVFAPSGQTPLVRGLAFAVIVVSLFVGFRVLTTTAPPNAVPAEGTNGLVDGSAPVEPVSPDPSSADAEGVAIAETEPAPVLAPENSGTVVEGERSGTGPSSEGPDPAPRLAAADPEAEVEKASPGRSEPVPDPRGEPVADASEDILLAALTDLPPPRYAAPEAVPGSTSWMRQFGPTRNTSGETRVEVRAPRSHVGFTLDATPRLWWRIENDLDEALQLTLVSDASVRPVLRLDIPGPHRRGLHVIDLGDHGIELESGTDYRWFVSVLVDPSRPSRNPVSAGALRRVDGTTIEAEALAGRGRADRGHALARLGIWYDAFDFFATLANAHPDLEILAQHVEALRPDPDGESR